MPMSETIIAITAVLVNNFLYIGRKLEKLDRLEADHKELKNDYKKTHDELIAL
ncbi:MAG: hypothetical protein LBU10_04835 [Endomicrobium sp.]|jgi:Tfp pilus assembly protein PilO|nr:hypothetical protein [Endomicrobium sp.]